MPHPGTRALAAAAALLSLLAIFYSVRFAWADLLINRDDLPSIQRAIQLTPLDSHARYAEAIVLAGAAGQEPALRAAIQLNPRNAAAWMELGIHAEMNGNAPEAERDLLHAAQIDHTFKPAWTLANFYFRANRSDPFWQWVHSGLEMVEPKNRELLTFDPVPLFDLCWSATTDPAVALHAIPRTRYVLKQYVTYLVRRNRLEAALQAARPLFSLATVYESPALADLCENLIAAAKAPEAVEVWNALSARKFIELPPLHPDAGLSLTNGDFRSPPTKLGFDWRFPRPGGVFETHSPGAVPFERLEFDGEEPEHCELLIQAIPVLPGRRYRFESTYETSGITDPQTGLRWIAGAPNSPYSLRPSSEGNRATAAFDFTADATLNRLVLRYDRPSGSTRPKGTLQLYSTALHLLP